MNKRTYYQVLDELSQVKLHIESLEKNLEELKTQEEETQYHMNNSSLFAERLRKIRCAAGLTQQDLADEINVHKDSICHWESGRRIPSFDTISKIANALGVSVSQLVTVDVMVDFNDKN